MDSVQLTYETFIEVWVMARLQQGKWNVSCDLFSESESQKGNHHEQRKIYLGIS